MARKRRFRSGGLQALHDRFIGDDPERVASFERALADANVAQDIYNLRIAAGLSQRALAARVGTTASVISRLEDADYEGHSLSMLRRIADALGRRVEVRFPVAEAPSPSPGPDAGSQRVPATKRATAPRRKATGEPIKRDAPKDLVAAGSGVKRQGRRSKGSTKA